ncbi:MAG TPA: hypothetical protein VGP07_18570 [Polyangia bacterium]
MPAEPPILNRRRPDAKPRASFVCDEAVATAYGQALERNRDHQDKIREEQKAWLRNRDACGDRASCIDNLFWRRVDDLKQE